MNDYELSKIADMLEEDALYPDEIQELLATRLNEDADKDFKQKYFDFYDDIKTTPKEDW